MPFTLTLDWWLLPLCITFVAFAVAFILDPSRQAPSGFANIGDGLIGAVFYGLALIFSLIAWLLWSLF